jgi:tetratricopeptide (TPR) repeat protein
MKKLLVILAIVLLPTAMQAQFDGDSIKANAQGSFTGKEAVDTWIAQGNEMYRNGNYDIAVDYYGIALSSGLSNADLYYNIGNAYYRTGQMGRAILNYERALRLNPGMKDAKANLALANSRTADRITELPRIFIARWVDDLCTSVRPATWRIIWLCLLAIIGLSVVALRLAPTIALRKTGLVAAIVSTILIIIVTLLLIGSTNRYNARRDAIIMEPSIVLKASPEDKSTDKMILHEGTKVHILDKSLSGWYRVTIADGTTGWCHITDVERI